MTGPQGARDRPRGRLEPDEDGPGRELLRLWKHFWRTDESRIAVPRDIGVSVLAIIIVLAGLWGYTAQPFPERSPMVVVESGSMMHPDAPYGRVGTIDPGDLILVRAVDDGVVDTAYGDEGRTGYGGKGDVIVYKPNGRDDRTPIIHRAMTWVTVVPTGQTDPDTGEPQFVYEYHDERGEYLRNQHSVELPGLGIRGFTPDASGYVTRGDNPRTNTVADQVSIIRDQLVQPDWIVGEARGEIPWLGLLKLGLTGNSIPSDRTGWCEIGAAWAPCDTWVMLGTTAGTMIAVPIVLDIGSRVLGKRGGGRWTS